jgi:hypothetical protein
VLLVIRSFVWCMHSLIQFLKLKDLIICSSPELVVYMLLIKRIFFPKLHFWANMTQRKNPLPSAKIRKARNCIASFSSSLSVCKFPSYYLHPLLLPLTFWPIQLTLIVDSSFNIKLEGKYLNWAYIRAGASSKMPNCIFLK